MTNVIKFTLQEEFLNELEREHRAGRIDPPIVRFTELWLATNAPNISDIAAVATARVGDHIFRLENSVGAQWEIHSTIDTFQRFSDVQEEIKAGCRKLGLELREGMYDNA